MERCSEKMIFSEAESKQYKRKKKRRQLDALVDTIKLPRGRKNGSHELLDCQSESSDYDEFSVTARNPARRTSCICDNIIAKVVFLISIITCVSTCMGLIWVQWHIRQDVTALRNQITRVEQSDAFTPDSMTKFQTQLVSLNKSLTDLRSGTGGMKSLASSIEKLKSKVKSFDDMSVKLNEAIASSKDLFDLPKKVDSLTLELATMRNDVMTATTKQHELEARLDAMVKDFEVTKSPKTDTNEMTRSNVKLEQEVQLLGQSMNQSFISIRNRLEQQETKMLAMDEFIKSSGAPSPVAASLINKIVKDALQESLSNLTSSGSIPTGELDDLLKQVEVMVKEMQQLKTKGQDVVSKGDFLLFKEIVTGDIKNVNQSILTFNDEFEVLSDHIVLLDSFVKNISSVIQIIGTQTSKEEEDDIHSAASREDNLGSIDTTPNTPTTTLFPSTKKSTAEGSNGSSETPKIDDAAKSTRSPLAEQSTSENKGEPFLKVGNITNMLELSRAYKSIKHSSEPLNLVELNELFGSDNSLTEEQIRSIDVDGDGFFSQMEIANAMGFNIRQ